MIIKRFVIFFLCIFFQYNIISQTPQRQTFQSAKHLEESALRSSPTTLPPDNYRDSDSGRSSKQGNDTIKNRKIKVLPVPAFGYSPETRGYIGAVTLFTLNLYNDSLTRTSNFKFEFNYTQNNQSILENEWNLFLKNERWYSEGYILFSKYPDIYYRIGNTTKESDKEKFISNRFELSINLYRKIRKKVFVGLVARHKNWYNIKSLESSEASTIDSSYEAIINGLGISLLKDTRNNILNSTDGDYFRITISQNFENSHSYLKSIIDLRYYKTLKKIYTFSFRFLSEFNTNDPPFFDLAMLGGDSRVRGYYYGRFRDNNFMTFQTEFRSKIYKRFGYAIFGGLSEVSNSLSGFNVNNVKPNYGVGLRFLIDRQEKINLRFDYGVGIDGQDGFYISFGESF